MATDLKLWVQVNDVDTEAPLPDAEVSGTFAAVTDAAGTVQTDTLLLTVTRDGYVPYLAQPYQAPSGVAPIPIHLAINPVPPPVVLPEITIRGHSFQLGDAVLWTAVQCSDFNLLNRWQHGEDISGVLAQRQACGFNLLRVWTAYDIPNIGTFVDLDYSQIPAFIQTCARYGLYVEFCAYTGINDPNHWPKLCDAARASSPRPLLELVNELSENTNEPDFDGRVFILADYAKPTAVLASHGSNGSEAWPVEPYWDYTTMHFNDAFEWQRKVGHNSMEIWNGPTLANENTRYCDKAQSLALAYDAAAGAALLCAGSCFHSVAGKTSERWDDEQEAAAAAWADGAHSVRLDYQDGQYKHPIELETPDLLRVYQRVYPDDRGAETVEIRKETAAATATRDLLHARGVLLALIDDELAELQAKEA